MSRGIEAYDAGELQRALDLLVSARSLLNAHDSAVRSLYVGLVYFALGDRPRALDAFGQAVRVEPLIRLDPVVHSPARVQAFEDARTGVVAEWRAAAQEAESGDDEEEALQLWRMVLAASPDDEQGRTRVAALETARQEREAAELRARADTVTARPPPVEPTGTVDAREARYDPGRAFALGIVVPGLGQVYTGRRTLGILSFAAAGAALAAGYLKEQVQVDCRSEPVNNVCPPEDILSERTERPFLVPGIAAAAGIALLGAIDAMLAARRANARADESAGVSETAAGLRLVAPGLAGEGARVHLELVRLRFR